MSDRLVSILNPTGPDAVAVVLGRRGLVRELLIGCLLSLALPLACLTGLFLFSRGAEMIALAIGGTVLALVVSVPVLWYAYFRLNAACLARERGMTGGESMRVYRPLQGPFGFANTFIAGSWRSRVLAGLPTSLGGLMVVGLVSVVTGGSLPLTVAWPLGLLLIVQCALAVSLLV